MQIKRDIEKIKECKLLGIDLIIIPYWWNKTKEQLIATIRKKRNDLFQEYKNIINENESIKEELPNQIIICNLFSIFIFIYFI